MDRDEVSKHLAYAVSRQRGHADFFDWPNKSVKEWNIAQSFCEELERKGGPKIVAGRQHPGGENHAPDFEVTTESGETWGIEITELVSQRSIEATKRGKYLLEEWSDNDLLLKFEALVAGKDRPQNVRGGPYGRYNLLVHVDEDMLPADRLTDVLGGRTYQTQLIDDIYLLLSYDPRVGHLPLLHFATSKSESR